MKSLILLPFLAAVVFASNHLDYVVQLAAGAEGACNLVDPTGTIVSAPQLPPFSDTNMQVSGEPGYIFQSSPCMAKNFTGACEGAFAYIAKGAQSTCFRTPAMGKINGTGNSTSVYQTYSSASEKASYLALPLASTLVVQYTCDSSAEDVELEKAWVRDDTITVSLLTNVVCGLAPETPTTTAAPIDDDDDHKLSTWAIVGIIVGAVVLIVGVGVACWKCRSSNSEDGEYRHVA